MQYFQSKNFWFLLVVLPLVVRFPAPPGANETPDESAILLPHYYVAICSDHFYVKIYIKVVTLRLPLCKETGNIVINSEFFKGISLHNNQSDVCINHSKKFKRRY